ncbi:MAG: hypothetical protein U0175_04240 [Caldilineaceae bacterium]
MNKLLQSQYVRCIENRQFIRQQGEIKPPNEAIYGLTVGKVYKRIPDSKTERHGMIRVIDESFGEPGSEKGYMFPADYFEPLDMSETKLEEVLIRVPSYIRDVLHAEAVASDKSISALVRDWIDERLDLPESEK